MKINYKRARAETEKPVIKLLDGFKDYKNMEQMVAMEIIINIVSSHLTLSIGSMTLSKIIYNKNNFTTS